MQYRDIARAQIIIDEGKRNKPYRDTVGKLTIGVGRNLDDKGLSDGEIAILLEHDINDAEQDARALVPNFDRMSDARKAVLINMALNLGRARLAGFRRFLAALSHENYALASAEMLDSQWAKQVGARATRLAEQMRQG